MIKITIAKEKDIQNCHQIDKTIEQKTSDEIFKKHQRAKTLFVASNHEAIIGYCYYKMLWDEEIPYISMIRVMPEWQNKGVGRLLFEHVFKTLKQQNLTMLLSSTEESNKNSLAFHHKLGFEISGLLDLSPVQKEKEIFLKRRL